MYEGSSLNANSVLAEGFNKQFITNRSGNFTPKSIFDKILFPKDKKVNFKAFYPYQKSDLFTRQLNIQNQQDQSHIDYLFGKSSNTAGYSQGPIGLNFERVMSKISLSIKGNGIQAVTAKFQGIETEGVFNLENGTLKQSSVFKDVEGKVIKSGEETIIEWIIFPGKLSKQSKLIFKNGNETGDVYTWDIAKEDIDYAAGNRYQYSIVLGKEGEVITKPNVSYMELPIIANSADLEYDFKMLPGRSKRNYSMLYDKQHRLALWVAYPLSRDYLGSSGRSDAWGYDPNFSSQYQPLLSKGFGIAGIDRGHQIPSADRTYSRSENATTFYYTNMTAQASTMNQGVWAKLEDRVRGWTTGSGVDTMYVVTGAAIQSNSDSRIDYVNDNGGKQVAKPKYYYKALAMKRGQEYYTIGFKINNEPMNTQADPNTYKITVSELEKETGYTFFPGLSEDKKQTINNTVWR
jgi:endonuclease G